MLNVIIGPIDVPNAIISTPRFPHPENGTRSWHVGIVVTLTS
jgi:hypothetical protein